MDCLYVILDANDNPIEVFPAVYSYPVELEIKDLNIVKVYDDLEDAEYDVDCANLHEECHGDIKFPLRVVEVKQWRCIK